MGGSFFRFVVVVVSPDFKTAPGVTSEGVTVRSINVATEFLGVTDRPVVVAVATVAE